MADLRKFFAKEIEAELSLVKQEYERKIQLLESDNAMLKVSLSQERDRNKVYFKADAYHSPVDFTKEYRFSFKVSEDFMMRGASDKKSLDYNQVLMENIAHNLFKELQKLFNIGGSKW